MVLTTSQLRSVWGPPCQGPWARIALFGEGAVSVRSPIVEAVDALDRCLRAHNYRTRKADTGAYNCRKITGGTGYSLHAYGIALDINWQSNPYGSRLVTDMPAPMVAAIKAVRTKNGKQVWRWGGDYSGNRDAMHFEVVCSPADLDTGIDPATVGATTPPQSEEDEDMKVRCVEYDKGGTGHWYSVFGNVATHINDTASVDFLQRAGVEMVQDKGKPLGREWQDGVWFVDGPLKA